MIGAAGGASQKPPNPYSNKPIDDSVLNLAASFAQQGRTGSGFGGGSLGQGLISPHGSIRDALGIMKAPIKTFNFNR